MKTLRRTYKDVLTTIAICKTLLSGSTIEENENVQCKFVQIK